MEWALRAWRGEERLWKAFWIYGVIGGIIFELVFSTLTPMLGAKMAKIIYVPLYLAFCIWVTVSTWRCAFNAEWIFFGYVVRILNAISVVCMIFVLIAGGFAIVLGEKLESAIGDPISIRRECEKITHDYAVSKGYDPAQYIAQNRPYIDKCVLSKLSEK